MPIPLLFGLIIGFVVAMPPGPVAITAIKIALDKGPRHSTLVGLGTGLLDFIYCGLMFFATSAIISYVIYFAEHNPLPILIFQMVVIVSIVTFGIIQIKTNKNRSKRNHLKETNRFLKMLDTFSHKGPFLLGVTIAIANMANPSFLPSLAVLTTWAQSLKFFEISFWSNISFAFGFGFGNFSWIYVLTRTLIHYKSRMSDEFIAKIHKFAGFSLITVGTLLGYRVVTFTPWSDIVRIFALIF